LRYLVDTHVLIWWLEKNPRLSATCYEAIDNPNNAVYASVVSAWEMSIKASRGKLKMPSDLAETLTANRFTILPIEIRHALMLRGLPHLHRDPFDRMLIAQARTENLTLVTRDPRILKYNLQVLEA
jgi:PIN domain nuclease of toxin-antitoxin system